MEIDEKAAIDIKSPENRMELKKFIDLIHPKLSWIIWWKKDMAVINGGDGTDCH